MEFTDIIKKEREAIDETTVVGVLKAKYFAVQDAIDAAETRHTKAVSGLNAPKAKEQIALHEIELLKARIEKTRNALNIKKKELAEVQEDLGEAKTEIEENADLHKEFKEAETVRTDKLEDLEDECKDAKEQVFEVHRKFNEGTRFLAMKECDIEAMTNRLNIALQRIAEVNDMKQSGGQHMVHAEKRGDKTAERKAEKEAKIEVLTKQIESTDDVTEDALKTISKLQLQREYQLDQIEYWNKKTQRVEEEINSANQEDWGDF